MIVKFIEENEDELVEVLGTWIGRFIKWGGNILLIFLTRGAWIAPMMLIEWFYRWKNQ